MMQQKLSPIVLNLLIVNVLVYVLLMALPMINPNLGNVGGDYFSLYKSNLLGFRNNVELNGDSYILPSRLNLQGGQTFRADEIREMAINDSRYQEILYQGDTDDRSRYLGYHARTFNFMQLVGWFFNHGGTMHILFNMIVLISIGPLMEKVLGEKRFLAFYLFCGLIGGILVAFFDPGITPVVGASGAIFGLILAFGMYFPNQKLLLFFFLPVKAMQLVIWGAIISGALVVLEAIGMDLGPVGGISHFGHLTGMGAGMLFFYVEKYMPFLK